MKIWAVVVEPFPGLPDGATVVKDFKEGETVSGDLARVAIGEGWAVEVSEEEFLEVQGAIATGQSPTPPVAAPKARKSKGKGE